MASNIKQNLNPFFKYVVFSMLFITVLALSLFKFIDILPNEYFIVLCIFLGLVTLSLSCLVLSKKGSKKRAFGTIFSILYIILLILGIVYELNTIDFLKKLGASYKTENYSIIVLKSSKYNDLDDLNHKTIGSLVLNTKGLKEAKTKLEKKLTIDFLLFDELNKLKESLLNKETDGILIENSRLSLLLEENKDFANAYKVIHEFKIDIEIEDFKKQVNITKDSFNIYVSGMDSYGSVSSSSRSDVNMVISVNPKTNNILITSIPRDYYINLAGINEKDKLTHSGIYGIETTVKSVEELLDIPINYYLKVNFASVVNLVDTLEGVNVYSKYNFTSIDGYSYKEGYNFVEGEKALSFVRERKAFAGGDRVRIENQAAMINAIIEKAVEPSIIIKYSSFIDALENSFVTNLDMDSITEFIKKQIDHNKSWNVISNSLEGTDDYQYTYSYNGSKLYVMIPNEESVINVKNQILDVIKK